MRALFLEAKPLNMMRSSVLLGRFWVVLGQRGSDQAETEQSWRATLELRFARFSAREVPLGLRTSSETTKLLLRVVSCNLILLRPGLQLARRG